MVSSVPLTMETTVTHHSLYYYDKIWPTRTALFIVRSHSLCRKEEKEKIIEDEQQYIAEDKDNRK